MGPRMKVGLDENGTGAWAGPAYVTGVCMPEDWWMELQDSKEIKAQVHAFASVLLSLDHFVVVIEPEEIDEHGMMPCLVRAYRKIARHFQAKYPDCLIEIDGNRVPSGVRNCAGVPGGDSKVPHIQAAAIIGKSLRDRFMAEQAEKYPAYKWETNAGYGTEQHREGLNRCGITPLHRVSFKPVRKHLRVQPNPIGANPVTAGLYSAWRKQEDGYKSQDT
jgi:ribonuclease HII